MKIALPLILFAAPVWAHSGPHLHIHPHGTEILLFVLGAVALAGLRRAYLKAKSK